MKNFRSLVLAAAFTSLAGAAVAEDQTSFKFDQGSVIIHCAAPTSEDIISTELFNAAYPLWITNLQNAANEGKIARAHYMNEIKGGIFIVAIGDSKEIAMANAVEIKEFNEKVLADAVKESNSSTTFDEKTACQMLEIGPVAILPQ